MSKFADNVIEMPLPARSRFADECFESFEESEIARPARSKFADPVKIEAKLSDFTPYTVAWAIQRVVEDVRANPELNQHGESKRIILGVLQRDDIGKKDARSYSKERPDGLSRQDIVEFAKRLRKTMKPATVNHYIGSLSVVFDHCNSTWDDCVEITRAPIAAARPYLKKNKLVGKSTPRKERPTEAQIAALKAYAVEQCAREPQAHIAKIMPDLIDAARISSRRLGELCRIVDRDIDYENKVYWVRDLKHPTKKKGNDKKFILWPELEAIFKRQPKGVDGRIFPVISKSCSAWYTKAKKPGAATEEGIFNLRFHDNRRDAISSWLLKGLSPDQVRKLVSGHETVRMIESIYDGRDVEEMKAAIIKFFPDLPLEKAA